MRLSRMAALRKELAAPADMFRANPVVLVLRNVRFRLSRLASSAAIGGVVDRLIELRLADPLSQEIGWVVEIVDVADLDLAP